MSMDHLAKREYSMRNPILCGLIGGAVWALLLLSAGSDHKYMDNLGYATGCFSAFAWIIAFGLLSNADDESHWETGPAFEASIIVALLFACTFWSTTAACMPVKTWILAMVNS